MLLYSLTQIQTDPIRGLVTLSTSSLAIMIALIFHEFSHALAATNLGDHTAKHLNRLSLRPLAHLDPIGTTMIILVGFGWGKPVPVNASNLRWIREHTGMALVALAGPLSNVVIGALFAIPIKMDMINSVFVGFSRFHGDPGDILGYAIGSLVFWNLLLAAFNLIPLAPLDGFRIALGFLPKKTASILDRLEYCGPIFLLLIIGVDLMLPGRRILASIIRPILNALSLLVLGRQLW